MERLEDVLAQPEPMEISESVSFLTFASLRQKEIIAMENSISNPSTTKLIFQKLPPQMRRRVMSHNSKRLPIRLRDGHMNQLAKSGLPLPGKRPSRCYRRRPSNLKAEYKRRQKTKRWLETHIWHAKRFHMIERWGFKLPEAPCDKSFRAAFRATSAHCLLQDISYYACVQLSGNKDYLVTKLKSITNTKFGLTFAAKAYLKGNREGCVELVHNESPFNAIGKVNFMWNPVSNNDVHDLWIFVHPSFTSEVLDLLIKLFNFKSNIEKENELAEYCSSDGTKLTLVTDINRFSLTGPLANAILRDTLHVITDPLEQCNETNWSKDYFKNAETLEICEKQALLWNSLKEIAMPSEINSHLVLGLNILDPRLQENIRRTKSIPGRNTSCDSINISENLCSSALWESSLRTSIKNKMVSNGDLCKLRNKLNLVPGETGTIRKYLQPIPIILIQKPGTNCAKLGYGSGWDIIVPPNYAMPLWISLIIHGARAGGLRDSRNICFELQQHYLFPDTKAGKSEATRIYEELKSKYFRLPPAKRVNYIKIGINSPFQCHWQLLVNEWTEKQYNDFHVLREISTLKDLQLYIENKLSIEIDSNSNIIVPVSLLMIKKGLCKKHSIICLPNAQDMELYKKKEYNKIPIEKIHLDENKDKRRLERRTHLAMLKKLKRKRVLAKKAFLQENKNLGRTYEYPKHLSSEIIIKRQLEKIQQLWLPEKISTVRQQCSKEVMGYVTEGGFSFTQHTGVCLGFVCLKSLIALRTISNSGIVVVRNTTSRKYSFAKIKVMI